jgi:hypothetical protein
MSSSLLTCTSFTSGYSGMELKVNMNLLDKAFRNRCTEDSRDEIDEVYEQLLFLYEEKLLTGYKMKRLDAKERVPYEILHQAKKNVVDTDSNVSSDINNCNLTPSHAKALLSGHEQTPTQREDSYAQNNGCPFDRSSCPGKSWG